MGKYVIMYLITGEVTGYSLVLTDNDRLY